MYIKITSIGHPFIGGKSIRSSIYWVKEAIHLYLIYCDSKCFGHNKDAENILKGYP